METLKGFGKISFSCSHGAQTCAYGRGEWLCPIRQFKGTLKTNFCSHVQATLDKIEISSQLVDETHFLVAHFCRETI